MISSAHALRLISQGSAVLMFFSKVPGNRQDEQGCSLGLKRLGVEAVSRCFLERLSIVSVLKVERLGLESSTSEVSSRS